jgi:hypothetical protein
MESSSKQSWTESYGIDSLGVNERAQGGGSLC